MAKCKRMDQIKSILKNYLLSGSIKATARQLNMSRNTVREYVRRALAYNSHLEDLLEMEEEELQSIFYAKEKNNERLADFEQRVDEWLQDLPKKGVTRHLLWEEYRAEYSGGYGYTQFCEHLSRVMANRDLTISLEHNPGESLMVDFTGKKMYWVEKDSGEVHACEVLACVMPFSQYSFCIALPSQSMADFIHGLNQCFLYLGVLPKVILSDNLKSYVNRPDRYEPTFTQLCEQLGAHYQIDLQAARVGKPRDKASVENAVTQVYRRIYAPLRNEVFHSLEALNEAIIRQLKQHNEKPYQKRPGSRKSEFDKYERCQMRDLPPDLFEIKKIARAKVQRNYHVFLGEEKNFYSVPYQYVGKRAEVVYTRQTVEVYVDGQRIATHDRLFLRGGEYRYQTRQEHMPKNHQEWQKAQGYDGAYFLKEAARIGPATEWAIQQILLSRIHEPQAYNSCKGILSLVKTYSAKRVEAAADRCQQAGKATYSMLKNILKRQLDLPQESPPDSPQIGQHENIRGAEQYQ
jgi:transposase